MLGLLESPASDSPISTGNFDTRSAGSQPRISRTGLLAPRPSRRAQHSAARSSSCRGAREVGSRRFDRLEVHRVGGGTRGLTGLGTCEDAIPRVAWEQKAKLRDQRSRAARLRVGICPGILVAVRSRHPLVCTHFRRSSVRPRELTGVAPADEATATTRTRPFLFATRSMTFASFTFTSRDVPGVML